MNKKYTLSLGALLLVAAPVATVVSCESSEKTNNTKFASTPATTWIKHNSWSAYVVSNPFGESLDIPEMYNGAGFEHSNDAIFKKGNKDKSWEVKYEEITKGKTDDEVAKILKDALLKINKEAKKYIVANNTSKFVIYCVRDTNQRKLIFKLKEIKQRTGSIKTDVDNILERFADESDIEGGSFPELHGHVLWAKTSPIKTVDGKRWVLSLDKKKSPDGKKWIVSNDKTQYPYGRNIPLNDHKLKIKDSSDGNTPKTLDPRVNDPETKKLINALNGQKPKSSQKLKIQEQEKKWVDAFIKRELLDKKANINSYPYIDYKTKQLKVMLISADQASDMLELKGALTGSIDAIKNAKELSYKVITIKNALPTTLIANQQETQQIKDDTKKILKASMSWIALNGGAGSLKTLLNLTKGILPQVQGIVELLNPLLDSFTKEYKEIPRRSTIEKDYKKLPLYKNIDKNIDKIIAKMKTEKFNLSKVADMRADMLGGSSDVDSSPYRKWKTQWVIDTTGKDQAYLTNILWLLGAVSSEII